MCLGLIKKKRCIDLRSFDGLKRENIIQRLKCVPLSTMMMNEKCINKLRGL